MPFVGRFFFDNPTEEVSKGFPLLLWGFSTSLLWEGENARGGNPASAPNNQRLLTGSPLQTQEIRPGKKSLGAFGNDRGAYR